jgi:formate/nitrite transporter FocA (FNT family)
LAIAGGGNRKIIRHLRLAYVVGSVVSAHIIAGSVDCAFLILTGQASWAQFFLRFSTPTLLGNMLGGIALVAVLNYGQLASEIRDAA